MWRFGRPCDTREAVNAEVARTRLSDGLAAEVLFATGRAVGGASALSRSKGRRRKDHSKILSNGVTNFATLAQLTDEQFVAAGISRTLGSRIRAYVRRRMR